MLVSDQTIQSIVFPVNKDFGEDENFFRIITDGGEVHLPKMAFQKGVPLPDTIACRVKGYNGKTPILGHDMARYVSEFYADGFSRGEDFEFNVISLPDDDNGFYRLQDKNGLQFKLRDKKSSLSKGQSVKCRFEILDPNFYTLRRSDNDAQLQMINLRELARVAGFRDAQPSQIRSVLLTLPDMEKAVDELDHNRASWVLHALRTARVALPVWFREALDKYQHDKLKAILLGYKYVILYLLQGSGFMRNLKTNERLTLQQELTGQVEQADIYLRTLDIIVRGRQKKFISDLLDNLKESGYLYHPNEQFAIMMILFRLSPELVNTSMGSIFDTLMGWELDTWKTEPFRQAFVEQLEIYIRETSGEIDLFMQPETAADNEKIEKVLTAIAIQKSLHIPADRVDMEQNMSLFYRYLSLLRTAKAQVLLQKSYLTLMGVSLPVDFTWSDIKEPTMMMTRAAVDPPANAAISDTYRYYLTNDHQVEIGPDGIKMSRLFDNTSNPIPSLVKWPGIQAFVTLDRGMTPRMIKSLDGHDEFWHEVETAMFMPLETSEEINVTARKADIDDIVLIEIDRVLTHHYDPNRVEGFHCKVVDEHYLDTEGYLLPEKLVNYNLHGVTVGTFRHDDGTPMRFEARVIGIDDNDRPVFSLLENTHQAVRDIADAGASCYCVITKDNGRSYSAISENGFGLFLNKDKDEAVPFRPGNVVLATITGYDNEAVQGVIDEGPIDNFTFLNSMALHHLLEAVAVYRDEDLEEDMRLEEEELVTREEIREIVQILRYKAVSVSGDILQSYDYLGYARLLALIINDEPLAEQIKAHKEILLQYQHYAKNKKVYAEDIERVSEMAPESVLIQRMASRLRIVSALEHSEENTNLWDVVNQSANETERQLAKAVLSYNMLHENGSTEDITSPIKDRIARMLNIDDEQRRLKYYGSESQYVEFKSSLVYPARKGRSGLSLADPDVQEHEILHIIAGFLNSTGGVLYIGVNDDHYERGLEDDLTFYRMDNSERNNKYRRSIKNLDNVANYLQNLIEGKFYTTFNIGSNVGDYAKVFIDDESLKGVVYVKVDPCPHIVKLDDKIYVRHSAKTEALHRREEIDMFMADRASLYQQQAQANAGGAEPQQSKIVAAAPALQDVSSSMSVDATGPELPLQPEPVVQTREYPVKTATTRLNVLHEWQDPEHFQPARFYIRFTGESDIVITEDEWSIDDAERLVLNVHDDEAENGQLLMVFDGEMAIRVPLRDLQQKTMNTPLPHFSDAPLVFATVVKPGDGLYTLHMNTKNTLYERVTPIERITQGNLTSQPERLLEGECASTEIYEGVPQFKMHEFAAILSTGMKRSMLGALAKGVNSSRTTVADVRQALRQRLS